MIIKVQDIMSKPPITINHNSTLKEAAKLMIEKRIGFLIVLKEGKLYGVISERDILKAIAEGKDPSNTMVDNYCSKNIITVKQSDTINTAAKLMRMNKIRHLVVIDDYHNPVGTLSIRDLLREENMLRKIEVIRLEELNELWF